MVTSASSRLAAPFGEVVDRRLPILAQGKAAEILAIAVEPRAGGLGSRIV
jgi:hypothetical protein